MSSRVCEILLLFTTVIIAFAADKAKEDPGRIVFHLDFTNFFVDQILCPDFMASSPVPPCATFTFRGCLSTAAKKPDNFTDCINQQNVSRFNLSIDAKDVNAAYFDIFTWQKRSVLPVSVSVPHTMPTNKTDLQPCIVLAFLNSTDNMSVLAEFRNWWGPRVAPDNTTTSILLRKGRYDYDNSVSVVIRMTCADYYQGCSCETYCKADTKMHRWTCSPEGHKICTPGNYPIFKYVNCGNGTQLCEQHCWRDTTTVKQYGSRFSIYHFCNECGMLDCGHGTRLSNSGTTCEPLTCEDIPNLDQVEKKYRTCKNGGTCRNLEHAEFEDADNEWGDVVKYACNCTGPSFTGRHCEQVLDSLQISSTMMATATTTTTAPPSTTTASTSQEEAPEPQPIATEPQSEEDDSSSEQAQFLGQKKDTPSSGISPGGIVVAVLLAVGLAVIAALIAYEAYSMHSGRRSTNPGEHNGDLRMQQSETSPGDEQQASTIAQDCNPQNPYQQSFENPNFV